MPWRELERQAIELALAHTRGNKPLAARLLGVAIRTVYRHLDLNEQGLKQEDEIEDRETIASPTGVKQTSSKASAVPKSKAHNA